MPLEGDIATRSAGIGDTDEAQEEKATPLITADGAIPAGTSPNEALKQKTQLSADSLPVSLQHGGKTGTEYATPKQDIFAQEDVTQDLRQPASKHELQHEAAYLAQESPVAAPSVVEVGIGATPADRRGASGLVGVAALPLPGAAVLA